MRKGTWTREKGEEDGGGEREMKRWRYQKGGSCRGRGGKKGRGREGKRRKRKRKKWRGRGVMVGCVCASEGPRLTTLSSLPP